MKNLIAIETNGEQLISTVNDGTNRLFINDEEIPSSLWVGTGNYTTVVNGYSITIAKVADTDGNVVLTKTGEYSYQLRKSSDGGIIIDDVLSDTSENPVQNKVIKSALDTLDEKRNYSHIEYGEESISTTHNSTGTVNVTFDEAFTSTPYVIVSLYAGNANASRYVFLSVSAKSATGFTIHWRNTNTASSGADYSVRAEWIAIR